MLRRTSFQCAGGRGGGAEAGLRASAITPTTVLMATVVPDWTRIFASTPDTGAGISASTLSVEISNRASPRTTVSPTFLIHLVTVPSTIVAPICGITTSVMNRPLLGVSYCPAATSDPVTLPATDEWSRAHLSETAASWNRSADGARRRKAAFGAGWTVPSR